VADLRMRSTVVLLAASLLVAAQAAADVQTVREPAFGLPHFFATTDLELARENGREIAKDRLAQIILLGRVGRGTLYQAFGPLEPSTFDSDYETRLTGYTSSELNSMYEKLPQAQRDLLLEYCRGVNDTIESILAGDLPKPLEVTVLGGIVGDENLFGNATNISDQVDPFYRAPGGADPDRPNAGFQFTPEIAMAIGALEVRNFGLAGFDEASRLEELQALIAAHGQATGSELWSDLNFSNDPLAPVSVPDPDAPGFGGPLARAASHAHLVAQARRFPRRDWRAVARRIAAREEQRAEVASRLGAWPKLGSYAWAIAGSRSATGWPWIGGFPQTGIQTPSIMHFAENRTSEGIRSVGMEFAGAPIILIGQTDHTAWTTTTAQLPVVDSFFEEIVSEDADALRYDDEGTPAPLSMRTETILGPQVRQLVFWRSHERGGNGGSRPVLEFVADVQGTADGGDADSLSDAGAFSSALVGGYVALVGGTGAGQIRQVAGVPDAGTLTVSTPWTTAPDATSQYAAAANGASIVAVAIDSAAWLEESTAVLGFSRYQESQSVMDVRAGVRLIPSTHNFLAADDQSFNGYGTASANGNIGYWSSGFSRIRQGGEDPRLPLDGTAPNPLVVASGTVEWADASGITAPGAFAGMELSPPPVNFRYDDPTRLRGEYIVAITSGAAYKQTRRIASNGDDSLVVESDWGVVPQAGDHFEVYEIVAMPEVVNPAEGYTANWNNKAATADPGDGFGRQHRVIFILEQLAGESAWDRDKQRQLNKDVAGLDGKGAFGRYLIPRLRQAVDAVGNGGDPQVDTVLAALEAHQGAPSLGREFVDPVADTTRDGEISFLEGLASRLGQDIFGDELAAVGVPGGSRRLALVQHAIDAAAGDLPGAYAQAYGGDYFNGAGWETVVRDALAARVAAGGIPADSERGETTYEHPLAFFDNALAFPPTPEGNRGVWEQIVEVGPTVRGEFIFPLGQSGLITGNIGSLVIDPNVTSLHPIWRDWRFVPMLPVAADLESAGSADDDGDQVFDAYERWYFGDTSRGGDDDGDGDLLSLADEFQVGSDPTDSDTDDDMALDGQDEDPQDRLLAPEPGFLLRWAGVLAGLAAWARRRRGQGARTRTASANSAVGQSCRSTRSSELHRCHVRS
jgi:hypothetical protein